MMHRTEFEDLLDRATRPIEPDPVLTEVAALLGQAALDLRALDAETSFNLRSWSSLSRLVPLSDSLDSRKR